MSSSCAVKLEPHQAAVFNRIRIWHVLVPTWFVYAAFVMGRRPVSVNRADMSAELQLSKLFSGNIVSSFLAAYTLGQIVLGTTVRLLNTSSINLLVGGLLMSAVSCIVLALTSNPWLMVVAWFVNGFSQAVGWASCLVCVTPWIGKQERGTVMGLWSTNMAAGGFLANVLLTATFPTSNGGWRRSTMLLAVIMSVVGVVAKIVLAKHPNALRMLSPHQLDAVPLVTQEDIVRAQLDRDGQALLGPSNGDAAAGPHCAAATSMSTWQLVCIPGVAGLACSYALHKLVRYVLTFWLPFYLAVGQGYSAVHAALVAGAFDFGGVAGSVCSGYAADGFKGGRMRLHFCVLLVGGLMLAMCGFVMFEDVFRVSPVICSAVVAVCGACSFGIDSILTGTVLQDFVERQRIPSQLAAISGLVGGVGALGSVLQGPTTVIATTSGDWIPLFVVLQVCCALAVAVSVVPLRLERAVSERGSPTSQLLL